jgi:hypothetical protein
MGLRRFIRFLLAVLVTAGLTVAPLVTPVAAKPMAPVAMAGDMSADMPCCPDKQKSNDCQDCPLVAMCMLKISLVAPTASGLPARLPTRTRIVAFDELITDGLDRPPPDHPPRSLV